MPRTRLPWLQHAALLFVGLAATGCESTAPRPTLLAAQQAIDPQAFGALVERLSEEPGYFDTDNLISNETGYLNVLDALAERAFAGGAYIGVGPDQNYSYIAEVRPSVAFIVDVRRDNLLHHLLLKSLMEMAPTRIEFLSLLHGVEPPSDLPGWEDSDIEGIVQHVDSARALLGLAGQSAQAQGAWRDELHQRVRERVSTYGVPLSEEDFATIRRFHSTFMREGPSLRFSTFGRPPRPYYPTYR